ncbi:MAG: hypothetical protein WC842_02000 [Candidatus Paceibacterota bacterium]|jgi:hypothetical protein
MNKKNYFLFFIFLGLLGVISVFNNSAYSQGMRWESPATKFPISGNEKDIFDEGNGPGETKKRTTPLIFDGVGQVINFGVGQSISNSNKNSQIMFGPQGIVITSLAGPVSLDTKGLVLKDYGSEPSAATGSIALINSELKFNTDGTASGWKLSSGEGFWKRENNYVPAGFYYRGFTTADPAWIMSAKIFGQKLACDADATARECGEYINENQEVGKTGGYDEFVDGGITYIAPYDYYVESGGGISYTGNGSGYYYSYDLEDGAVAAMYKYILGYTKLSCDIDNTIAECDKFIDQGPINGFFGIVGQYDEFVKDGKQYLAIYGYETAKVSVGSDSLTKDLIVNGSVRVGGKLSFSPKQVFKSANIKATISGAAEETMEIIDTNSGRKDFSFCALGHQLLDNNGYYTGALCSVFYDGNKKVWILKAQRLKDGNASECGAICF